MASKTRKTGEIYQFKITLKESKPVIWRRILIPKNMTFRDLHGAIQDSMGWRDYHSHQFSIKGTPISGKTVKIERYFERIGDKVMYEYDFGNRWKHEVVLEMIIEDKYPQCIAGKRSCPPEDCGGVYGYRDLLDKLADPEHKEHLQLKEWVNRLYPGFQAEAFDPKSVNFIHFTKEKETTKSSNVVVEQI